MSEKRKVLLKIFIILPILFLLIKAAQVYAGREQQPSYHLEHPRYGKDEIFLPTKFISIVIDGSKYYYCDGVFYRRGLYKYVAVEPPVGAVVPALPFGYETVIINDGTYYTYKGVYYQLNSEGYVVVPQPAVQKSPAHHKK